MSNTSAFLSKLIELKNILAKNLSNLGVPASGSEKYNLLIDKVSTIPIDLDKPVLNGEEIVLENTTKYNDIPSSVVSVEYPEQKNLFDINNPQTFYYGSNVSLNLKIENGIIYSAGVSGQTEGQGLYIRNPKKTITISFNVSYESTETTRTVTIRGFNSLDSSGVATTSSIEVKTNITSPTTITITNTEFEYIGITWFSSTRYGLRITNLQIEKGSTATSYEPFKTYDIGVQLQSKNLFDVSSSVGFQSKYQGVTSTISGTTITTSSTANRSCSLLLGDFSVGTYTISFSNTDFAFLMLQYGETLEQLSRLDKVDFKSTKSHTFTLTQPVKLWLESTISTNQTRTITDIQLEEGSTATAYTPYISDFSSSKLNVSGENLFNKSIPFSNYATDSEIQYGTLRFYVGVGTPVTISFTAPTETFTAKYMFVTFSHLAKSEQSAITKYQWLILNNEVVKTVWTNTSVDGYFSLAMTESTYNFIINNNIQIELGSTATPYSPFQGQTYTANTDGAVSNVKSIYPLTNLISDNNTTMTVSSGTYKQITPSTGKNSFTKAYQPTVDSSIDNNIKPEYIRKGVTILGVTGTYEPTTEES